MISRSLKSTDNRSSKKFRQNEVIYKKLEKKRKKFLHGNTNEEEWMRFGRNEIEIEKKIWKKKLKTPVKKKWKNWKREEKRITKIK